MLHKPKPPSPGEGPSGGFEDQKHSSTSRKSPPAVPTTRTSDAEVQGRKDPCVYRKLDSAILVVKATENRV